MYSQSESEPDVYAIVRAGGRQEKVSLGDTLIIDKVGADVGDTIDLAALLVVDGQQVTADPDALSRLSVRAEVVKAVKGPKIRILKYKNKTGYRKRQGHRQALTQVKITAIGTEV